MDPGEILTSKADPDPWEVAERLSPSRREPDAPALDSCDKHRNEEELGGGVRKGKG